MSVSVRSREAPVTLGSFEPQFLENIGLDLQRREHALLYQRMQFEALQAYGRIATDSQSLLPHLRNDPAIHFPYALTQVTEAAMQYAVDGLYNNASAESRRIYDQALERGSHSGENWIIRWLLWRAFYSGGNVEWGESDRLLDGEERPPRQNNFQFWDPIYEEWRANR